MKVTIIPTVIGAQGTVTKGLVDGLEDLEITGRMETIQTSALLRSARILRRVLETWGDLLSLKLQWETISWRWCEKLNREQIIIIWKKCRGVYKFTKWQEKTKRVMYMDATKIFPRMKKYKKPFNKLFESTTKL